MSSDCTHATITRNQAVAGVLTPVIFPFFARQTPISNDFYKYLFKMKKKA